MTASDLEPCTWMVNRSGWPIAAITINTSRLLPLSELAAEVFEKAGTRAAREWVARKVEEATPVAVLASDSATFAQFMMEGERLFPGCTELGSLFGLAAQGRPILPPSPPMPPPAGVDPDGPAYALWEQSFLEHMNMTQSMVYSNYPTSEAARRGMLELAALLSAAGAP